MGKIDIKKLKKQLSLADYEKIIKALNIPIMIKTNTHWVLMTGCHNKNPYDGSPKLYLYLNTFIFQCVTKCCASFDIIGLVQKRLAITNRKSSFMDAVHFIIEVLNIDIEDIERFHKNKYEYNWEDELGKYIRIRKYGTELPVYDKNILTKLQKIVPESWIEEGISPETLNKYHIGYYERTNSTTIPCLSKKGELIGIRVRNWQEEDLENGRKYMPLMLLDGTCYKFPTNDVFYGINYNAPTIESTGTVILVEGEKSVMKADTWFGNDSNVLALYGSQIGIKRRNQLLRMGVKNIILALDSDFHKADDSDEEYLAFEKKIFKLSELFKGYCQVEVMYNNLGLEGYKYSPFDFTREEYEKLYENREIIE